MSIKAKRQGHLLWGKRWVQVLGPLALLALAHTAFAGEVVDRVVAVVNDDIVLLSDLEQARNDVAQERILRGEDLAMPDDRDLLQQLIEDRLAMQEADRLGIDVTSREIDQAIGDVMQANQLTLEELQRSLAQEGIPFDEYRDRIGEQLKRMKLTSRAVSSRVSVDQSKMRSFYSANRDQFREEGKIHLRRVFFPTADDAQLEAAHSVRERLLDQATLRDVAPTVQAAGGDVIDLGFLPEGDLRRDYVEKARGLEEGEWSQPFVTPEGVHLIQVAERTPERVRPFEEVKDRVEEILRRQESERQFAQWLRELRDKSHVRIML